MWLSNYQPFPTKGLSVRLGNVNFLELQRLNFLLLNQDEFF